MNAALGLQRTRTVVAGAYRGWRWALPLACALTLTTTLAVALEAPLARSMGAKASAVATRGAGADLRVATPAALQMLEVPASVIHADQPVYTGPASQAARESLVPSDVISKFLSARQVRDLDAALALFETDATITDSDGTPARGADAALRLIQRYNGMVAGAPRVSGNEVVWTEAFPIRTPDNLQFQQDTQPELSAEVPYYALVHSMCAVVTNGKIHALFALAVVETFAPDRHCAVDADGTATTPLG